MKRQLLYIMRCGNKYKFGISNNPKRRIKQLQTGCPYNIKLIFELVLDKDIKAVDVETQLHQHLKRYNVRGEWFSLTREHVLCIAKELLAVGQNQKFIFPKIDK